MDLIHVFVITAQFSIVSSQGLSPTGVNVCNVLLIYKCCSGWKQQGSGCPIAICSPPCLNGKCTTPNKCTCNQGYTGSCCEKDINECEQNPCQQLCSNKEGSYVCSCHIGYKKVGDKETSPHCEDINECDTLKPCQQDCTNNPGSYTCSCRTGYRKIGQSATSSKCEDINECDTLKPCQQNCTNNPGSYTCSCRTGYRKIDQSATSSKCEAVCSSCVHGLCVQPDVCKCFEGFELNNCSKRCDEGFYGRNCNNRCLCKNKASCDPKNGSCTCAAGWQGKFCEMECIKGWGLRCQNTFTCEVNNTISKDFVDGKCICAPGYTGQNCESNCPKWSYGDKCLRECACARNNTEICNKVNGNCDCFIGWNGTKCEDPYCEGWRYGMRCNKTCLCIQNNTESCDPRTGACTCKTGWMSETCNIQVDERSKGQSETPSQKPFTYGLVGGGFILILIIVGVIFVTKRKNSKVNKRKSHITTFKSFPEEVTMAKKSTKTKTKNSLERNEENDYIDNHISFVTDRKGFGDDYIKIDNTRSSRHQNQKYLVASEKVEQPIYDNMPTNSDVRESIYENMDNVNDDNAVDNGDHYMSYVKDISEDDTYTPLNKSNTNETYDKISQGVTLTEPEIGMSGEELYGNVISESALYGNVKS